MDQTELTGALRRAEQRRDEVMAFLSHDMRSPLSSILALLELHGMDPESHPVAAVHARIEELARQALLLNEQFGHIASAETRELRLEAIDPADLCAVAIDAAWELTSRQQVAVDLASALESTPSLLILADHDLLAQAVSNLLTVMARLGTRGSRIAVGMTTDQERALIEVTLQETGVHSAGWQQLFTPAPPAALYSAGHNGVNGGGHTGGHNRPKTTASSLELALARIVLERHGGHLAFENTPAGGRITAILPLHRS